MQMATDDEASYFDLINVPYEHPLLTFFLVHGWGEGCILGVSYKIITGSHSTRDVECKSFRHLEEQHTCISSNITNVCNFENLDLDALEVP